MTRTFSTLVIAAVVAGWAGAQAAPTPAPEQLRLLRANSDLLEQLLGRAVAVSDAPDRIGRADECRKAVATLGSALERAADERDPDAARVAELTDRVADLLETGLAPVLEQSREQVRGGSPGAERLAEVETDLAKNLADCRAAIAPVGRVGGNPQVREARAHLERAREAVAPPKK